MHAWVVGVLENFAQLLIRTDNVPLYIFDCVNALSVDLT
jgi:hypothetical protein